MLKIYHTENDSLATQYLEAGKLFGETIRTSVHKIAKSKAKAVLLRKKVAEKVLQNLASKPQAKDFLECLTAWSNGAQIATEQAMWLLADNLSGCQTMIARYGSGVALLHTEEDFKDIKQHMTGEQTLSFIDKGRLLNCLVYNDLMPGAGLYGWEDGMINAVDSLFLREDGIENVAQPVLANIISWMIWRMPPSQAEPTEIIKLISDLGELIDGYAINIVRKVGKNIEGYKLTLARSEVKLEYLVGGSGSYLVQANIVDPKYGRMMWALPPRNIWRGGYKYFLKRMATMSKHARKYQTVAQMSLDPAKIERVHKQIQKTIATDLASTYVNHDLGAICIGLVDKSGTSVSINRLIDDKSSIMCFY